MFERAGIADLGRFLVLMTVPSASTTVKLMTHSFIVPYRTAFVPLSQSQYSSHLIVGDVVTCNSCRPYRQSWPVLAVSEIRITSLGGTAAHWNLGNASLTDGPGSTGKNRPESLIWSLRLIQGTEGWTTTSILQVLHQPRDDYTSPVC
jgi:hypothetical protein